MCAPETFNPFISMFCVFCFVLFYFVAFGKDCGPKITGEDCREERSVYCSVVVIGRRQVGLLFFILVLFNIFYKFRNLRNVL